MKNVGFICLIGIMIYSCSGSKKTAQPPTPIASTQDTLTIENDSLGYEIIIIEPGFNAWLTTQKPRGFYGQYYLEQHNRNFVREYNLRVLNPNYNYDLYEQRIDYDYTIDYGYEVNYLLYNYFMFFQERYHQKL